MYQLSPAQQVIVGKAKEIACSVLAEQAADVDEKSRFPVESMAALAEGGFYGLLIPAELGGMGGDLRLLAAVVDELAQACGSTAMIYMMHSAGVNCYLSHPDKFKGELLDCVAGKHLSTLAFSESGSRSEFWAPVSQAIASGDGVTLSASKSWVTSAGIADGIVASCNAPDGSGASVYLVKKGDTGLSISGGWSSLGMRGNQSNPMTLSDVTLPDETRLIGEAGKGGDIMLGTALPVFLICQPHKSTSRATDFSIPGKTSRISPISGRPFPRCASKPTKREPISLRFWRNSRVLLRMRCCTRWP